MAYSLLYLTLQLSAHDTVSVAVMQKVKPISHKHRKYKQDDEQWNPDASLQVHVQQCQQNSELYDMDPNQY